MQASQVIVVATALTVGFCLPAYFSDHDRTARYTESVETAAPAAELDEPGATAPEAFYRTTAAEEEPGDGAGAVLMKDEAGQDLSLITFDGQVLLPRQ
ncbi:MAG: hypothetical protein AB7O67_17385 [Vicinamibacterales bacterium]